MAGARTSFLQDARSFAIGWRIWFGILWFLNLVAPLFFLSRPEAWATLACFLIAAIVIVPMHRRFGWVRLLGVGHLQWLLLVPWLVYRYLTIAPSGAFAVWLVSLIVVNAVCVTIDIADIFRYSAGDRQPVPAVTSG